MKEIEDKVQNLVEPFLKEKGFEIYDIQYKKEGHGWVLRIFADTPSRNISLDQCAEVSEHISSVLDQTEGLMTEPYSLEVSSPGLDRLLRNHSDFVWASGKTLKTKYKTADGKKETVEGILSNIGEDEITLNLDKKKTISIKIADIESARRVMKFSEIAPKNK